MSQSPHASGDEAQARLAPSLLNPTAARAQDVLAERDGSKGRRLLTAKPVLQRARSGHGESPRGFALETVGGEPDRCP
jgi:hypothetical protein